MKTPEEIKAKIASLEKVRPENDYELCYLRIALEKDPLDLDLMYLKYSIEARDDLGILRALS